MQRIDLNSDLGEGYGPWTMGDDAAGSCGGQGAPDAIYRLDLRGRTRLRASFASAEFPPVVYLQRTCGDQTSEVFCLDGGSGTPIDQTLAAGTYYLVVDGADQNAFGQASLQVQLDDLSALEASCRAAPMIRPGISRACHRLMSDPQSPPCTA